MLLVKHHRFSFAIQCIGLCFYGVLLQRLLEGTSILFSSVSKQGAMGLQDHFESDIRFYYAIGIFIILVYLGGIAAAAVLELAVIDRRLIPLTVGFFLFMFVYFIAISVQRLEPDEA